MRLLGGVALLCLIVAVIAVLAGSRPLAIGAGALGILLAGYVAIRRESGPPAS
jgi:hypothetical protein